MITSNIVIGSICYVFYRDEVLLLKRANPPYQGLWSPPGGKMELGESPEDCCIREIHEETGILISAPELRAIQTVVDIAVPIHWQLFIYRSTLTEKVPLQTQPDHNEGELRWCKLDTLDTFERAYTDLQHWSAIMSESPTLWQGKFVFDTPAKLLDEQHY